MDSFNDPLLLAWRSFGDWGFKLVIVGVVGELLAAFTDFLSEKLFKGWHSRWKSELRITEFFFGAVLIIGLAMEYRGHKYETQILDSHNADLQIKAGKAEQEAAAAKVLADRIETTNAQLVASNLSFAGRLLKLNEEIQQTAQVANDARSILRESNTVERLTLTSNLLVNANKVAVDIQNIVMNSNLEAIKVTIPDRTITSEQRTVLFAELKPYLLTHSEPSEPIEVWSVLGNLESYNYANELADALTNCGFSVEREMGIGTGSMRTGTDFYATCKTNLDFPIAIANALVKAKIPFEGEILTNSDDEKVSISVRLNRQK